MLYAGPTTEPLSASDPKDFILLELKNGFPHLRINRGSGEVKLAVNGKDSNGQVRLRKLNDRQWHRVDIIINSMVRNARKYMRSSDEKRKRLTC